MPNNLFANGPYAVVAKQTISFADAGVTVLNMNIIYLVDGVLKSYMPGRSINAINGFETGKGYYVVPKQDLDFSAWVIPPIDLNITTNFKMLKEFRVGDPDMPAAGANDFTFPELAGKGKIAVFCDGQLLSDQGYTDVLAYTFVSLTGTVYPTRQLEDGQVFQIYDVEN